MANENMVIEGGTKRGKTEKDGNIAKGSVATLAVGAVALSVVAISKLKTPAKAVFQIGKFAIKVFTKG